MQKVAFHTLGCKLNFSETSTIAREFEENNFLKVDFSQFADFYVINTCSVTENADKECKQIVKLALKNNPNASVIVIGCYAQLKPQEIAAIEGVDLVLGAKEKFNIIKYLKELSADNPSKIHSCEIEEVKDYISSYSLGDRTRAFLKVQDGCDYTCSYCTIPLARGNSRSDSIENVLLQAKKIAEKGIKEIVLTGVNIGDFGANSGIKNQNFYNLVKALDTVEGVERFRISSIEPNLLKDEIIEFVSTSKRFVPHFHIPLQSGSNNILKLMRRRYKRELYQDRVNKIKTLMPHACIGVDVIVGFPGETEQDFLETYHFINQLDVSYLHVFTYSERDNTDAIKITDVVPVAERKKRNKMLRSLSEKKQRSFYENNLGTTRKVLFEVSNIDGYMYGYTDNYIRVKQVYDYILVNKIIDVKLECIDESGIVTTNGKQLVSIE